MEACLTIKQRMNLIALLQPMAASAAKRKIINGTINDLSLSEEEIKESGYTEEILPNGALSFKYHPGQDPKKTVSFGESVCEGLSKKFVELDTQEKIDGDLFPLWEIFVKAE